MRLEGMRPGLRVCETGLRACERASGQPDRLEGMRGKIGIARSPHGESRYSCYLLHSRGAQTPKN